MQLTFSNIAFLHHQSNGAKGLRIFASAIILLGWLTVALCTLAFIYLMLRATYSYYPYIGYVQAFTALIYGIVSLAGAYLTACAIRALASLAEAAQLYFEQVADKNAADGSAPCNGDHND